MLICCTAACRSPIFRLLHQALMKSTASFLLTDKPFASMLISVYRKDKAGSWPIRWNTHRSTCNNFSIFYFERFHKQTRPLADPWQAPADSPCVLHGEYCSVLGLAYCTGLAQDSTHWTNSDVKHTDDFAIKILKVFQTSSKLWRPMEADWKPWPSNLDLRNPNLILKVEVRSSHFRLPATWRAEI